jgi:hypothetical protein
MRLETDGNSRLVNTVASPARRTAAPDPPQLTVISRAATTPPRLAGRSNTVGTANTAKASGADFAKSRALPAGITPATEKRRPQQAQAEKQPTDFSTPPSFRPATRRRARPHRSASRSGSRESKPTVGGAKGQGPTGQRGPIHAFADGSPYFSRCEAPSCTARRASNTNSRDGPAPARVARASSSRCRDARPREPVVRGTGSTTRRLLTSTRRPCAHRRPGRGDQHHGDAAFPARLQQIQICAWTRKPRAADGSSATRNYRADDTRPPRFTPAAGRRFSSCGEAPR